MSDNILITGASGFVGTHFVNHLKNNKVNYSVFSQRISFDYELCDYGKIVTIVHLAGLAHKKACTNEKNYEVNTQGTITLAQRAKMHGVKRFVFMSSTAVYGTSSQLSVNENTPLSPITPFAKSKYQAEQGILKLADSDFEVVIIRSPLVYGQNAPANFALLSMLVAKLPILPFALTKNRRSYISAINLADFISVCVTHPKAAGEIFVISDGVAISTKDLTYAISKGINKNICQFPVPVLLMSLAAKFVGKGELAKQLFGNFELDCSKVRHKLNWTPPLTMAQAMKLLKE